MIVLGRRTRHDRSIGDVVSIVVQILAEQLLPALKDGGIDDGTKLLPQTTLTACLYTAGLKSDVAKLRDLMKDKSQ